MPLTLEELRKKPYSEQMQTFRSNNDLYQQELFRVQSILKNRPDYAAGLKHYSVLSAVGAGQDIMGAINGTIDLSPYQFDPTQFGQPAEMPGIPDMPDYTSRYESQIDKILANLGNVQPFSYDPDDDEAFQAYLDTYEAKGQTAFNNQLGALSAASGGRASSWATSAASQAQNAYIQQGMSAMPSFMSQAYAQYRDSIGDVYKQADLLLTLDDRDFNRYKMDIENKFTTYNAEMDQWGKALEIKSQNFSDALERTKLNGFVSNEDALVLDVAPGTPSFEAQQEAREKQTWIEQEKMKLENEKELLGIKFEQEKKLINQRAATSGGSGGGSEDKPSGYSKAQATEYRKAAKEFTKFIETDEYIMMNNGQKMEYIESILNQIYADVAAEYYTEAEAEKVLKPIMDSETYQEFFSYENDAIEAQRIK